MKSIVELENLAFYPTTEDDLDQIMYIENMEENSAFIFSWTWKRHIKAIENSDELHVTIRRKSDTMIVGYVLFAGASSEDKVLEFRRIAISEKGKGYGRESIRLIKKLAFEKLNYHRLWLDVYDDNEKAINLYRSEGFVQEGILRECKKSANGYRSMIVMSILENEYFK